MTSGIQGRPVRRESGAALLTTMVAVAVLTAVAVDLAYSSRVSLQIAANARDELRASYAARSAVAMARLVLSFQQQLDGASPQQAGGGAPGATASSPGSPPAGLPAGLPAGIAGLLSGLAGGQSGGLAGALGGLPRLQLWNLIPIDNSLVQGLFPGGEPPAATARADGTPTAARGATFDARVDDEALKVNAQLSGLIATGDLKVWQSAQAIYQLTCDPRWDPLFDREDTRGVRTTREDLLVRLRDWVDPDERTSELAISGGAGGPCSTVIGRPPFVDAFGDENQPYDRGEDRYRAKNNRMDSLDELYLVAGVGDAFMAAFGDGLTVYLPQDAKRNVNVTDKRSLVDLARVIADPPVQPIFLDPTFADRLQKAVLERTMGGILSLTPRDLGTMVQLLGVQINASLLADPNAPNAAFTDRSTTFRIRASGKAGAVQTTIDAVVRLDPPQTGVPVAAPGRLIHWREE